jgi:hypothetical protein
MAAWLKAVDKLERSTFWFPSQSEGPDLLFFLRRREHGGATGGTAASGPQKILCSLQVSHIAQPGNAWSCLDIRLTKSWGQFKTGGVDNRSIPKILSTLAIKPWRTKKRSWPLIHILVANMDDVPEDKFDNVLKLMPQSTAADIRLTALEEMGTQLDIMEKTNISLRDKSSELSQKLKKIKAAAESMKNGGSGGKTLDEIPGALKDRGKMELKGIIKNMLALEKECDSLDQSIQLLNGTVQGEPGLRENDFVCCIDRSSSEGIWGRTFQDLVAMIKNKPKTTGS